MRASFSRSSRGRAARHRVGSGADEMDCAGDECRSKNAQAPEPSRPATGLFQSQLRIRYEVGHVTNITFDRPYTSASSGS